MVETRGPSESGESESYGEEGEVTIRFADGEVETRDAGEFYEMDYGGKSVGLRLYPRRPDTTMRKPPWA